MISMVGVVAQQGIPLKKVHRASHMVKGDRKAMPGNDFSKTPDMPSFKNSNLVEEVIIGGTRYDLQTNSSCQNRLNVFPDGTIGAVWTMGFADPGYADRGTGYNYFDGSTWGPEPDQIIESIKTGWPSYAPYGENGELVVSHNFNAGSLYYLTREDKGSGEWIEGELLGPDDLPISWNRSTTSGIDHSVMQMIYITWPIANGGSIYEGMDGALLYSRSSDGGANWDYQNELLDGMTANEYTSISADNYEWAASKGDNIAFLVGDFWTDLFLMKSVDGGDTWTKTVIWECPYPLFDFTTETDTFHCSDGAHHLAFDSQNKVHVVFGINRTYCNGSDWYYYTDEDGLAYWNEDMPTFSNNINALNPYGHPDSELEEDVNLIGWSQDLDGNGELDFADGWGVYNVGLTSMPQIVIDDMDYIYVVFSSLTEGFDNGEMNYRHLWARGSWADGVWSPFVDLTSDILHVFHECVYPSVAPYTDDNFYLTYQVDDEPGVSIQGTSHPTTDNDIYFMTVARNELIPLSIEEQEAPITAESVSQNYPNPFTGTSMVSVRVLKPCLLSLEVSNLTGQVVYALPERKVNAGSTVLEIAADQLTAGVYFYSVKAGETVVTRKMVVE